jgi:hypothetical protein
MRRIILTGCLTLAFIALGSPAAAQDKAPGGKDLWLHIRVDDQNEDEQVRINLPFPLVESVLPLIDQGDLHGGRVHIGMMGHENFDMVKVLDALRDAQDGEYITVDERDEHVRITKQAGELLIRAEEPDETVTVRLHLAVAEALFATRSGDEIDIAAAMKALAAQGEGDLVTVQGEDENVRIWVDHNSTCE